MPLAYDPEKAALLHFLNAQRASVLAIVEGLDAWALNAVVLPSGWSPLGLVEHLGDAERHWFQGVALGLTTAPPWPADDDPGDWDGRFTTSRTPEAVFAYYRDQCTRGNAVIASTPLSEPPLGQHNTDLADEITDLRWITLHLIEETARHAGHLDVARELLDGTTGLGPR